MLEKLIEALKNKFPDADLADIEKLAGEMLESELEAQTNGLKTNRDAILQEKKRLEDRVKGLDLDALPQELEDLRTYKAQKADDEKKKLEGKSQWELLEKRLRDDHAKETKRLNDDLSGVRDRYFATLRDNALESALSEIRALDEDRGLLKKSFRQDVKIIELDGDDGKKVAKAVIANKDGLELSVGDYFKEWAQTPEGKRHIKAPTANGGGAGGGSTMGGVDLSKLSPTERLTAARAAGAK